jgi:hypothetical protein
MKEAQINELTEIYNAYIEAWHAMEDMCVSMDAGDGSIFTFNVETGANLSDPINFLYRLQDEVLDYTYLLGEELD